MLTCTVQLSCPPSFLLLVPTESCGITFHKTVQIKTFFFFFFFFFFNRYFFFFYCNALKDKQYLQNYGCKLYTNYTTDYYKLYTNYTTYDYKLYTNYTTYDYKMNTNYTTYNARVYLRYIHEIHLVTKLTLKYN